MYKNKIKICSNEQSWNNEVEHTHKKQIDAHRNWMISIIDHNWIACSIRLLKKKRSIRLLKETKQIWHMIWLYHRPHENENTINHNTTFSKLSLFREQIKKIAVNQCSLIIHPLWYEYTK